MCCSQVIDTSTISPLGAFGSPTPYQPPAFADATTPTPDIIASSTPITLADRSGPPVIPDILSMENELKSTGALLSEIKLANHELSSPLSHLQPEHLIQTPEGPKSAVVMPSTPVPGQTIQLASTAPQLQQPTLTQAIFRAQTAPELENNTYQTLLSGILIALTLASLYALGLFVYQNYSLTPTSSLDSEAEVPEASWYQ